MENHKKKMEAQLKSWRLKLEKLVDGLADNEFQEQIDALLVRHAAAKARLDEFKEAGDVEWERFRVDIWIAWNELENAFADFQQMVSKRKKRK